MKTKKKACNRCGELKIIWKNVIEEGERKRYCKYCWSCHNNSGIKPTANKPLRSRSPKRVRQESTYSLLRKPFLEKHPHCEIPVPGICLHKSTEVHHTDGRVEEDLNDEVGWRAACRPCHQWVHSHPQEARDLGYLI